MRSPRLDRLDYSAIINGAYEVAQRNSVGATQSFSAPQYLVHDRWFVNRASSAGGAGAINITNQTTDYPSFAQSGFNFTNSARLVCDTINSITNFHAYVQYIEGVFAAPCVGRKCVYQFWAKSNVAKNLNLVVGQGGTTNKRIGFDFVTESGLVWKKYQYAIDFSASGVGTPVLNTNISIELNFQLGDQGQTQGAVNGSWVNNVSPFFVAGKDTFMDNAANQLWFTGHCMRPVTEDQYNAVLNGGLIEMEHSRTGRDYAGELQLCRRYFEKSWRLENDLPNYSSGILRLTGDFSTTNLDRGKGQLFRVTKRATPAVVFYVDGAGAGALSRVDGNFNPNGSRITTTPVASVSGFAYMEVLNRVAGEHYLVHYTADAEL